jgi:hypothetical protein
LTAALDATAAALDATAATRNKYCYHTGELLSFLAQHKLRQTAHNSLQCNRKEALLRWCTAVSQLQQHVSVLLPILHSQHHAA